MKLELKIEAPGVQVYAYEIDAATKELLKENANNVFKESGIPELDEEEKKRIKENEAKGLISYFSLSFQTEELRKLPVLKSILIS